MSAVTDATLSAKINPPIPKDDETPAMTTKVCLIALACFAMIGLGFMTGNLGYSILVAALVGAGGLYWANKTVEVQSSPGKISHYQEMIEALGGNEEFNRLPQDNPAQDDVEYCFKRVDPKIVTHAITRSFDYGNQQDGYRKTEILIFKLQEKNKPNKPPFICTFGFNNDKGEEAYGFWRCNIDGNFSAQPHFPIGKIVDAKMFEAIKQLKNGTHPAYELVHPVSG